MIDLFGGTRILHRTFSVGLLAVLWACGGDAVPGESEPPVDLDGDWTFTEVLDSINHFQCANRGGWVFTVVGGLRTGTMLKESECGVVGSEPAHTLVNGTISQIRITQDSIQFTAHGCDYRANLSEDQPGNLLGIAICPVVIDGVTMNLTGVWTARRGRDTGPPSVSGAIQITDGDTLLVPGDVPAITVTATDELEVMWIGYRLGNPVKRQDSTPVRTSAGSHEFTVYAQWLGYKDWESDQEIVYFARDRAGNLTETTPRLIKFAPVLRRKFSTLQLGSAFTELEFDEPHQLLYAFLPERAQIAVIDLLTFTLRSPINAPIPPATQPGARPGDRFQLLPSGDSVVIATGSTLTFVNVNTGEAGTRAIVGPEFLGSLRATANNKLFFIGQLPASGSTSFGVWEYDIASGALTRRTEVGIASGNVNPQSVLARSGLHSHMALIDPGSGCTYMYAAATDQFTSCVMGLGYFPVVPSASRDGRRWLFYNRLTDEHLNLLRPLEPAPPAVGMAVVSDEGSAAYYLTPLGYRMEDSFYGTHLWEIRVPFTIFNITTLTGLRIILWTAESPDRLTLLLHY